MSASFAEHAPTSAESPPGPEKPIADPPPRLQYFAAFRYLFEQPQWLSSLLLASVAFMIPVFGTVALFGYYYEIVERIHRDPAARCPPFQFGRFALYCGRGVWSYLLLLAITSVLQPVLRFRRSTRSWE
jgi:hypothetical protein